MFWCVVVGEERSYHTNRAQAWQRAKHRIGEKVLSGLLSLIGFDGGPIRHKTYEVWLQSF